VQWQTTEKQSIRPYHLLEIPALTPLDEAQTLAMLCLFLTPLFFTKAKLATQKQNQQDHYIKSLQPQK
jgi:hypothetical protein